jgi:hypothetical protein
MCSTILSSLHSAFSKGLDCLDHGTIRLNRCTPIIRKTVGLAMIALPIVACLYAKTFMGHVPEKIEGLVYGWGMCLPTALSTGALAARYGWLLRPHFFGAPNEEIKQLLRSDAENLKLPLEYRQETELLLQGFDYDQCN